RVRRIKDGKERKELKKKILPNCTISGSFSHRNNKSLIHHSCFICIDQSKGKLNNDLVKEKLKKDPYTYSTFYSASGEELAIIVKINPKKHEASFDGLREYYRNKYGFEIDNCSDVSRPRYVSHDPDLFINPGSKVFKEYIVKPTKEHSKKKTSVETEKIVRQVEHVVAQVRKQKIILGNDSYNDWLRIGFALSDGLGEDGREYFHDVSSVSSKYDGWECDRQFDKCLNGFKPEGEVTISSFFYYAKEKGIKSNYSTGGTPVIGSSYRVDDKGCLYRIKGTKDGGIPIKLANFTAEIREEIIRDDGLDTTHNYHIEGTMNGRKLSSIDIPAISFGSMNWLYR
ncbi:MAG: hypothetical protein GY797_36015, partial [Deltaproteobacteria bacterium]|nr:hypothetical protein [Deltaproteobacteria bacterium]